VEVKLKIKNQKRYSILENAQEQHAQEQHAQEQRAQE